MNRAALALDSLLAAVDLLAVAFVAAIVAIDVAVAKPVFGNARAFGRAKQLVGTARPVAPEENYIYVKYRVVQNKSLAECRDLNKMKNVIRILCG